MITREELERKTSILKGIDESDEHKRRKELTRAGFSEYEIMIVSEPPEKLRSLIHEMLPLIPYFVPMRIKKVSWGATFLRDVRSKGDGYEKANIYAFVSGAAISPLDRTSTIFSEFSPELIILPDGRVSFTRSRVHYRGGLGRDIQEFNINLEEQRVLIKERMEMEFNRNPALRKKYSPKRGIR
jgi:Cft2 family RNA processing exonuclease